MASIVALAGAPAHADTDPVRVKDINIAANPFGPFVSYYDAGVSYALPPHVAISVSASSYARDPEYDVHGGLTMQQYIASVPLYLHNTFSGPFVEPGIIYRRGATITDSSPHMVEGPSRWIGVELLAGWQWNFDSGLNIALALGIAKHAVELGVTNYGLSYDTSLQGSWTEPDINGYLRVGYNFSL